MANSFSLVPDSPSPGGSLFAGKVSRASPIMVTIDSYGEQHEYGPANWLSLAAAVRGQRVLVMLDDIDGVWAAPMSTQGAGITDTTGAVLAAVEVEVNKIKAALRAAGIIAP